jgi:hypothetical protein
MDFYWPIFYLLVCVGLAAVWNRWHGVFALPWLRRFVVASICAGLFLSSTMFPVVLYVENVGKQQWEEVSPGFQQLGPMAWIERVPLVGRLARLWSHLARTDNRQISGSALEALRLFWLEQERGWQDAEGLAQQGLLPPGVRAMEGKLGVAGYRLDVTLLDPRGLTDRVVSRYPPEAFTVPNSQRLLGHDRLPPPGYLEQWGVNLKVETLNLAQAPLGPGDYRYRLADGRWIKFYSSRPEWIWSAFDPERLEPWVSEPVP